jgi:hypothetical protein
VFSWPASALAPLLFLSFFPSPPSPLSPAFFEFSSHEGENEMIQCVKCCQWFHIDCIAEEDFPEMRMTLSTVNGAGVTQMGKDFKDGILEERLPNCAI